MNHDVMTAHPVRPVPVTSITAGNTDEWRASIELRGEFDAANADELRAALDEQLDAGRRVLRIDTRHVTFMDSSAVGVIVHAHSRCVAEHGSLILTGVQRRVARLFQITGLDHVLLIDSAADEVPSEPPVAPGRRHAL